MTMFLRLQRVGQREIPAFLASLKRMLLALLITNAYAERLIGSIRQECLDHVLVFREAGLRQTLKQYFAYYERCRTHLSLKKDAPVGRPVEPPSFGEVIQIPQVGGLHHLYTRKAA